MDNSNVKNGEISIIYNVYEAKIFDLLQHIELKLKVNIEHNNIIDIDKNNENNINNNDDNNNELFNIDIIYCLINYIKFYNSILSKKIVS